MPTAKQHLDQARSFLKKNRTAEAEAELRKAVAADAGFAPAHIELAHLLKSNNRLEESNKMVNEILKTVPNAAEELTEKAIHIIAQKNYEAAVELLDRALMLNPKFLAAQIRMGEALRESGKPDESESILRKAMAGNARSVEVIYELASTL